METLVRPRTVVGRKEVDFRDDERKSKGGQREKKKIVSGILIQLCTYSSIADTFRHRQ